LSFFIFAIVIPIIGLAGTITVINKIFGKNWEKVIESVITGKGLFLILIIPWLIISWKINRKLYKDSIIFRRIYQK
jgi:hypothetical protein